MSIFRLSLAFIILSSLFTSSVVLADNASSTRKHVDETKKVVMFSSTFCPACSQAKSFFKEHDIAYLEFDIEKSAAARGYFERLGGRGTPFLLINNRRMQGFSETRFWNYYSISE